MKELSISAAELDFKVLEENFGVEANCLRDEDEFEVSWSSLLVKPSAAKLSLDFGFAVEPPC